MTLLAQTPRTDAPVGSVPREPMWRARVVAVCVALVALAFLQDPGRIAADTKLDLTVNPWGFLGRALHLWDPEGFFGQLQNQAYGYLWPMGPFFGLGQTLGLPDWVVQRLWWALILVAAFLGMYALASALRIGSGWPRILAGLAYALAVRPQTGLGAVSVEVWPMALAPWVLVPLVRGAVRGNIARAAALSALAVLLAGGVNAVAAGAVLPLALWWLLTLEPGPRRRGLLGWWCGLTLLAILWWLIPLVVLGRYSPPFLDWIESASFTTSITDPTTVLRGADHWVAYLGTASAWKAGWMLATYPVFVVATAIVAAAGVAGLAMRSLPHRGFLVGGAVAGVVLVGLGHTGVMSGLGSDQLQAFLDAAGAPLRNVHKFDLVLRIPLILAFCHLLGTLWPTGSGPRWRTLLTAGLVAALAITWWPAVSGQLVRGRTYVAVADHWRETAEWLNTQAEPGRALIVPGASFGQYVWGRTQDEPLQAFGGYPWGIRDAVPLSSAGNIRMLDAVEARLEAGRPSAGLAQYLDRMGVRYLVVRNDLAPAAQAPPPIRVHQALDGSMGLTRVAWFGPIVERPYGKEVLIDEGMRVSYPAVEIYEVTASNAAPDPRVVLRPADSTMAVDGAPEAALSLADTGALGNRVLVLAGDPDAANLAAATGVVTDTDRRREITFGYMRDNESTTMTEAQEYQQSRAVHDYRVFGAEGTTVATPGLTFDASSSPADTDATWRQPRGASPAAAMDGAMDTYWRPGALDERQSFWEVTYDEPIELGDTVDLALLNRGTKSDTTIPLEITTDNGTTTVDARDRATWQSVPVAAGPTRSVRVAVPDTFRAPLLGIREIRLPGEAVSTLGLPRGESGDSILLTARPGDTTECVPRDDTIICSDGLGRFSQDRPGLSRVVDLPSELTAQARIAVIPRDTASVSAALNEVAGARVEVTSTRTGAVAGSGPAALDRRLGTAWQAAPEDPQPAITITLPGAQTMRGIRLVNRQGLNASSPLELKVEAGGRTWQGFTDNRGLFRFDPVTTDRITIRFLSANQVRSRSDLGELSLPLGVSEIGLIGADDARRALPADAVVSLPCGSGPTVELDGRVLTGTSISARVDQFMAGEPLGAQMCESPIRLPSGQHDLVVRSSAAFQPVTALFTTDHFAAATGRAQSAQVLVWDPASRTVEVSAGEQPRVLELAENYNPGWAAHAGSQQLAPVRVDGWKQAFIVPAGTAGQIDITYGPDRTYRWGLLVGLVAALAVVFVAIRPPRRPGGPPVVSRRLPRVSAGLVAFAVLLTLGPWGVLAGGLAWLFVRRLPLPAVAFAGVLTAGVLSALAGVRPGSVVAVLQGCALATAWAVVLWAGLSDAKAAEAGGWSARSAAPDVR
ncbi:MAG TPA: alpha-(1-_3)-arabinofuranosyltransferase [Actinomycetota bacterium]|nr:alpha-(1->3)-arabinofuranosyltransferase [Actinomycetota bacterium]